MSLILLTLALSGCKRDNGADSGSTAPPTAPTEAWHEVESFSAKTGADGLLEIEVEVIPGQTAFMVSATARNTYAGVSQVIAPDGTVALHWSDWWNSNTALTDAIYGYTTTTAFNWPVREEDGPLAEGTWTVHLYSAGAAGTYVDDRLSGTVWRKEDADLAAGVVPVHIVYAKGADKPKVKRAVDDALVRWREIWDSQGLTLAETVHTSDIDTTFNFLAVDYYAGSNEIENYVAETIPPGELVMLVGESIGGWDDTFGLAGGIPGTLQATPMTWVLISWLAHAGVDGEFDDEEARIMGETMAHEVGHYSGLYHPVECPYDCEESWDALADTPDCMGWQDCEQQLASNLMYPYPVCDFTSCTPAGDITADQAGVWHRYTGTR